MSRKPEQISKKLQPSYCNLQRAKHQQCVNKIKSFIIQKSGQVSQLARVLSDANSQELIEAVQLGGVLPSEYVERCTFDTVRICALDDVCWR